jgi:hypothetical protein
MLISNSLLPAFKNAPKKVKSKKPKNYANTQNSHHFVAITFLGAFV